MPGSTNGDSLDLTLLDLALLDPGERAMTGEAEPDLGNSGLLPRMLSMLNGLSFFSDDMMMDFYVSYLNESQN